MDYFAAKYDPIRRDVVPHAVRITEDNVEDLRNMEFVFLSMDAGPMKRVIIDKLREWNLPFVDCGMGVRRQGNSLRGKLRATAGIQGHYDHIDQRISFVDVDADEYAWNIQTADLNMMNAAMAVLKWKKLLGYYVDSKQELNSVYTVSSNQMLSGELAE